MTRTDLDPGRLLQARNAVTASFFLNGFAFASIASRIPDLREELSLSDAQLGLTLLGISIGSVLALPLSGPVIDRFGPTRVVRTGTVLVGFALVLLALAVSTWGSVPLTLVALFCYGVGTANWDVAMNLEGAEVERLLGRTIMPRFHAVFSLGTVLGSALGAPLSGLSQQLAWHLVPAAVLVGITSVLATGSFLPRVRADEPAVPTRRAWRERRTLMIGLIMLSLALAEGTANDWLALGLHDGYDVARWVGVLGLSLFVASMTLGRLVGPVLLDRFGRVPVLFGTIGLAAGGTVLVVFGAVVWLVVPGIVLWGLGASLGFPVGVSAAADDPARAAARVSVVTTIGYTAFLAGPPLVGFVAHHTGTLRALLVVAVVMVPALVVVPAARSQR